jgi:hypothetical protein
LKSAPSETRQQLTPLCPSLFLSLAFAPAARAASLTGKGGIIHLEIQPKNINKVVQATIPVLGDVVANLGALVEKIEYSPREEWFAKVKAWKEKYPFIYEPSKKGERMKPQEVVEELDRAAERMGSESFFLCSTFIDGGTVSDFTCSPPSFQRRTSSLPPESVSIRCGPASITDGGSLDPGSRLVVLECVFLPSSFSSSPSHTLSLDANLTPVLFLRLRPWALDSLLPSEPRSPLLRRSSSTSMETPRSR